MPIIHKNSQIPTKSSGGIFSFVIQFAVVGIIFFLIGFAVGQKKVEIIGNGAIPKLSIQNQTPKNSNIDFTLMWEVLDKIPEKYIDRSAIDGNKLLYGAISGMVRSLGDPYTAFLDPKQNEAVKSELAGTYEGVGIQIGFNRDRRLVVIAPLSGTPAQRVGLKPKDLILKIEDKETFDLALPEAVDLIRGQAGTKVKLLLQHEGEDKPFEIEVERAKITVKSVEVDYRKVNSKNVAIVKVSRFGDTTDSEWDQAVGDVKGRNVDAIIVDMRNNPGGLLSSSIHVASEFIGGVIVKQQDSAGRISSLSVDHKGAFLKTPMVVLVNGGSASAAEIFAGAIQDNARGKVVGEKTFGKGTVQEPLDLTGGSSLHVTVAKWLTPDGHSIHGVGIDPDVTVEDTEDGSLEDDPQLQKALELIG
ncbi:MAG: S41 family peptidase [Candidatus Curtissbacteria bacterium]|nr:S41 family peptidase [Candidatus Curtissbacteria bacterium]